MLKGFIRTKTGLLYEVDERLEAGNQELTEWRDWFRTHFGCSVVAVRQGSTTIFIPADNIDSMGVTPR